MSRYAACVATLLIAITTACEKKSAVDNVPALPALPAWIMSSGYSKAGAMLDVTHPMNWRAVIASTKGLIVDYNSLNITPDSGGLTLLLPDQSGLFVFGMDSVSAATTADVFINRKLKSLSGGALRADSARTLSTGAYQSDLRTEGGSKTGVFHVVTKNESNKTTMLWRMFLGDADGNNLAMQIAIDSLKVRRD